MTTPIQQLAMEALISQAAVDEEWAYEHCYDSEECRDTNDYRQCIDACVERALTQ
jgi:hypothetical protein